MKGAQDSSTQGSRLYERLAIVQFRSCDHLGHTFKEYVMMY